MEEKQGLTSARGHHEAVRSRGGEPRPSRRVRTSSLRRLRARQSRSRWAALLARPRYPCSGTKPIESNAWFDVVHGRREMFVANTLAEIAQVFPDHELIGKLGCGSVVNLPIILGNKLQATMNILDREHHYSPERTAAIASDLSLPAKAALLAFERLVGSAPC